MSYRVTWRDRAVQAVLNVVIHIFATKEYRDFLWVINLLGIESYRLKMQELDEENW